MPEITRMWPRDFRYLSDQAKILGTMYFPAAEDFDKRVYYACSEHAPWSALQDRELNSEITLTVQDVLAFACSGLIDDLSAEVRRIERKAFFAAHWLQYRIYCAAEHPESNGSERWAFYLEEHIKHKLPEAWQENIKRIKDYRATYATVAHLWLAHFEDRLAELDPSKRRFPSRTRSVADPFAHFLERAAAYQRVAMEAGIYNERRARPVREEVWRLPKSIPSDMVVYPIFPSLGDDFNLEEINDEYEKSRTAAIGNHYRPGMKKSFLRKAKQKRRLK